MYRKKNVLELQYVWMPEVLQEGDLSHGCGRYSLLLLVAIFN
jgi:hypothetical protein